MSPERTWHRSLAAVTAWCLMTSVATAASWWGLSAVLTAEPRGYEESAVAVNSDNPDESTSDSESPKSRTTSSEEPEPSEEEPETEEPQNELAPEGWTPLGNNTFERTFDTKGGIAVIQVSPEEANLVSASPAEGYQAETTEAGPRGYVVTFYGMDGAIVIKAGWRDGEPYGEVSQP